MEIWAGEHQNHRTAEIGKVGRHPWGSSAPTPSAQSRGSQSRLLRTTASCVLNMPKEGDSTTSLGICCSVLA